MLRKRLTGNFLANIYAQAVATVFQLLSVPLFLACWSKTRYGEWLLVSSLPAYISMMEGGFSSTSANEVSMFISQGDFERARVSLHTACGFLAAVCLVALPIIVWGAFGLPWNSWLHLSQDRVTIGITLCLIGFYTLIGLGSSISGAIYRGAFQNARNAVIVNTGRLAELLATAVCVASSTSLVRLAGGLLLARCLTVAVLYFDGLGISPRLRLGLSAFSLAEFRRIWRPSLMFMSFSIGNALYFQGLTLIVGRQVSVGAVVVFNTTRTLSRTIVQFVGMIKHSIWPEFSYLFGAGDLAKARRLNELAFEVTWVSALGAAILLYAGGPYVMAHWTRHAVQPSRELLALFLLSAVVNSLWFIMTGLIQGVNRHEGMGARYLLATAIALVVAGLLVRPLGLPGVALAMVLCEVLLLPHAVSQSCALLGYSVKEMVGDALMLRQLRLLLGGRGVTAAHRAP